jgi:hypothetical protein
MAVDSNLSEALRRAMREHSAEAGADIRPRLEQIASLADERRNGAGEADTLVKLQKAADAIPADDFAGREDLRKATRDAERAYLRKVAPQSTAIAERAHQHEADLQLGAGLVRR